MTCLNLFPSKSSARRLGRTSLAHASLVAASLVGALVASGCGEDSADPGSDGPALGTGGMGGGGAAGMEPAGTAGTPGAAGMATGGGGGDPGAAGADTGGSDGGGGTPGAAGGGGEGGGGAPAACVPDLGKAMQFKEGVTDQMNGHLGAKTPSGDSPRTLELWAKFSSAASWKAEQTIIEMGRPMGANNMVWGIDMSGRRDAMGGGRFGPYCNGVSDNNGDNGPFFMAAPDVGWLHLSWGYEGNGGKMQFTVNGEQIAHQDPGNGFMLNLTPGIITLGASQNFGKTGWDGVMDELRIWSTFRTVKEIQDNMRVILKGDEVGLAAYFNFDEATPTKVPEIGGDDAHALLPCMAGMADRCNDVNDGAPTVVDSDIPGDFTCAE